MQTREQVLSKMNAGYKTAGCKLVSESNGLFKFQSSTSGIIYLVDTNAGTLEIQPTRPFTEEDGPVDIGFEINDMLFIIDTTLDDF